MSDTAETRTHEPDPEPPAASEPAPPSDPIVVIQYRDRFLPSVLILPLLILLLAVTAVAVIRANTPDWPGLVALRARRVPALRQPPAMITAPDPTSERDPPQPGPAAAAIIVVDKNRLDGNGPLDLKPTAAELAAASDLEPARAARSQPDPAMSKPTSAPAEAPEPAEAGAPTASRNPLVAIGFDPPGTPHAARQPNDPPEADAESDTQRAREEIAREAAALHARRQQVDAQRPLWLEQNAVQGEQNHGELLAQALANAEADRPRFRADVRKLLAELGNQAGPQLEALCDEYGRELFQEVEDAGRRQLGGPVARLSKAERVKVLRAQGFTEQRLLLYLRNLESRNILARGGPQDSDEALVRAAHQLLAVPLGPTATAHRAASPRAPAATSRRISSRSVKPPGAR